MVDLRIWLSWCDLGRTNEGVGKSVSTVENREWWWVAGMLASGVPGIQGLARLDEPTGRRGGVE